MSVQTEPRDFLSGKSAQVDVAKIESEVRALWKQATSEKDGVAGNVTRAVSFTLLCFSHDADTESELAGIMDDIMAGHPCRAILTFFRPEKPHALAAYVNARCHLLGTKKYVCSEQITVHADGASPQEVASVVSPLVLADLPSVLWWRSGDLTAPVLQELKSYSRKLIFDSGFDPFELGRLQAAAKLLSEKSECIWISDLNWRRMTGWRRSLAEAFDGFPMPSEYLQRVSKVKITVRGNSKTGGKSTQALLLTGWLASRLNWNDSQIKNVEYDASDENLAAAPGAIKRVEIEFDDNRTLHVKLERSGDSYLICAQESESEQSESTRVDQYFKEGILVGQELEAMSRDHIFEHSLRRAAEIIGANK